MEGLNKGIMNRLIVLKNQQNEQCYLNNLIQALITECGYEDSLTNELILVNQLHYMGFSFVFLDEGILVKVHP